MQTFSYQTSVHDLPEASRFFLTEDMLLLDIESTGLSAARNRIYLIGLGHLAGDALSVMQYLTECPQDEILLLKEAASCTAHFSKIVTFNGTTFDLPFLKKRAARHALPVSFDQMEPVDLFRMLHSARPLFPMQQFRQKNYEAFLGISRDDQYDGGKLIPVYHRFEKQLNASDAALLCLHNKEDLFGMFHLLSLLAYPRALNSSPAPARILLDGSTDQGTLNIFFTLDVPVPVTVRKADASGILLLRDDTGVLALPVTNNKIRHFLPDPENYYYLPAENKVVHKSVGQYVDAAFRRKAAPEECFTELPLPDVCSDGQTHALICPSDVCSDGQHALICPSDSHAVGKQKTISANSEADPALTRFAHELRIVLSSFLQNI